MDIIWWSEQKIHYAEKKITGRPGKDIHMFKELDGDKHDNPKEFCDEQVFYYIDDEISI